MKFPVQAAMIDLHKKLGEELQAREDCLSECLGTVEEDSNIVELTRALLALARTSNRYGTP